MCSSDALKEDILAQINAAAKGKLVKWEVPKKVYVVAPDKVWTNRNPRTMLLEGAARAHLATPCSWRVDNETPGMRDLGTPRPCSCRCCLHRQELACWAWRLDL